MASFIELKTKFGWKYALREMWDCIKWHRFNVVGIIKDLL